MELCYQCTDQMAWFLKIELAGIQIEIPLQLRIVEFLLWSFAFSQWLK